MFEESLRGRKYLMVAVIFFLPLLIFGRSLFFGFVNWDDPSLITQNPLIRDFSWHGLRAIFTSYDPELYTPLTFLSFQLNYFLGGLNPFGYHAGNLLLHALNSVLVFLIINRLSKGQWVALIAALLFAVHPIQTEAVVWAAARKDVLASFFFLGSLRAFVCYTDALRDAPFTHHGMQQRFAGATGGVLVGRLYLLSLMMFVLGLLSKVSIIMLPFVLFQIDWYRGRGLSRRVLIEKIPFFVLSIIFGIVAMRGKITGDVFFYEKFLIACKATLFYLVKLMLPQGLSVLYPYTQPISLTNPDLLFSVAGVITLTVVAVYSLRWTAHVFFAWFFFLLMLLPTFQNIVKGHDELLDVYFATDRAVYLASVGLFLLAGLVADFCIRKWRRGANVTFLGIVGVLGIIAFLQTSTWKDDHALFGNVLAHYPNSHVAHTNRGAELYREGKIDEALNEFARSVQIRPNGLAYYNLGQLSIVKGMEDNAIDAFQHALASSPADTDSALYLGALLINRGRHEEAVQILTAALEVNEALPKIYEQLGRAYEGLGRKADAVAAYRRSLELDPGNDVVRGRLRE